MMEISTQDVADACGVSYAAVIKWRRVGTGPAFERRGGRYFFPLPGVIRFAIGRALPELAALRERIEKLEHTTATRKPRRVRQDGQPDERRGHTSYANRIAQGERFEDLPALAGRARSSAA